MNQHAEYARTLSEHFHDSQFQHVMQSVNSVYGAGASPPSSSAATLSVPTYEQLVPVAPPLVRVAHIFCIALWRNMHGLCHAVPGYSWQPLQYRCCTCSVSPTRASPALLQAYVARSTPLPTAVATAFAENQASLLCGVLPELDYAWTATDDALLVWPAGYQHSAGCLRWRSSGQLITAVGWVVPRARVFPASVALLAVVATSTAVHVLALQPGTAATPEPSLSDTGAAVHTAGAQFNAVAGTPTGRVFLAGTATSPAGDVSSTAAQPGGGYVAELTYMAPAESAADWSVWMGLRPAVKLVPHSLPMWARALSAIAGSGVLPRAAPAQAMLTARGKHELWCLSSDGTMAVYNTQGTPGSALQVIAAPANLPELVRAWAASPRLAAAAWAHSLRGAPGSDPAAAAAALGHFQCVYTPASASGSACTEQAVAVTSTGLHVALKLQSAGYWGLPGSGGSQTVQVANVLCPAAAWGPHQQRVAPGDGTYSASCAAQGLTAVALTDAQAWGETVEQDATADNTAVGALVTASAPAPSAPATGRASAAKVSLLAVQWLPLSAPVLAAAAVPAVMVAAGPCAWSDTGLLCVAPGQCVPGPGVHGSAATAAGSATSSAGAGTPVAGQRRPRAQQVSAGTSLAPVDCAAQESRAVLGRVAEGSGTGARGAGHSSAISSARRTAAAGLPLALPWAEVQTSMVPSLAGVPCEHSAAWLVLTSDSVQLVRRVGLLQAVLDAVTVSNGMPPSAARAVPLRHLVTEYGAARVAAALLWLSTPEGVAAAMAGLTWAVPMPDVQAWCASAASTVAQWLANDQLGMSPSQTMSSAPSNATGMVPPGGASLPAARWGAPSSATPGRAAPLSQTVQLSVAAQGAVLAAAALLGPLWNQRVFVKTTTGRIAEAQAAPAAVGTPSYRPAASATAAVAAYTANDVLVPRLLRGEVQSLAVRTERLYNSLLHMWPDLATLPQISVQDAAAAMARSHGTELQGPASGAGLGARSFSAAGPPGARLPERPNGSMPSVQSSPSDVELILLGSLALLLSRAKEVLALLTGLTSSAVRVPALLQAVPASAAQVVRNLKFGAAVVTKDGSRGLTALATALTQQLHATASSAAARDSASAAASAVLSSSAKLLQSLSQACPSLISVAAVHVWQALKLCAMAKVAPASVRARLQDQAADSALAAAAEWRRTHVTPSGDTLGLLCKALAEAGKLAEIGQVASAATAALCPTGMALQQAVPARVLQQFAAPAERAEQGGARAARSAGDAAGARATPDDSNVFAARWSALEPVCDALTAAAQGSSAAMQSAARALESKFSGAAALDGDADRTFVWAAAICAVCAVDDMLLRERVFAWVAQAGQAAAPDANHKPVAAALAYCDVPGVEDFLTERVADTQLLARWLQLRDRATESAQLEAEASMQVLEDVASNLTIAERLARIEKAISLQAQAQRGGQPGRAASGRAWNQPGNAVSTVQLQQWQGYAARLRVQAAVLDALARVDAAPEADQDGLAAQLEQLKRLPVDDMALLLELTVNAQAYTEQLCVLLQLAGKADAVKLQAAAQRTWTRLLVREPPVPAAQAAALVHTALTALSSAHPAGVLTQLGEAGKPLHVSSDLSAIMDSLLMPGLPAGPIAQLPWLVQLAHCHFAAPDGHSDAWLAQLGLLPAGLSWPAVLRVYQAALDQPCSVSEQEPLEVQARLAAVTLDVLHTWIGQASRPAATSSFRHELLRQAPALSTLLNDTLASLVPPASITQVADVRRELAQFQARFDRQHYA